MDQGSRKRMPRRRDLGLARRRFLKGAVSAAALSCVPHRIGAQEPRGNAVETVLVIGAGLAGLAAAQRLKEAGRRVSIVEASARAGGRVHTVRGFFDAGLNAELGAARIAETHEYVLHWLNDLNLALQPFAPETGAAVLVLNGVRARTDDPRLREKLTPDLSPEERGLSPPQLLARYLEGVPPELTMPELDLSGERWAEYDRVTWPQWLAQRGASKAAIAFMTLGGDSHPLSALYILRQIMLHRDSRQYFKIEGGMDRLPQAIADGLSDSIRYNCAVVKLSQTSSRVEATCKIDGRTETITADRALVTLPFSILRSIAVDPPFSPEKQRAIASLSYRAATRFVLETRDRFWAEKGLSGGARSDAPADIWDMSYAQAGGAGLLSVTTGGAEVEARIAALSPKGRASYGVQLAAAAFPETGTAVTRSYVQQWAADPYAKGAFAVFLPDQLRRFGREIGAREGRIHFAGEHLSPFSGWMEGALWSAERAAQEILDSQ